MKLIKPSVAAITALTLATSTGISSAALVAYAVDDILTGATPSDPGPWLTVSLVDIHNRATDPTATADYVMITLELDLANGEFISKTFLDINPVFASASVQSTFGLNNTNVGSFQVPTITVGQNKLRVGGNTRSNGHNESHIELGFTTSNSGGGAKRFNNDDVYTFVIKYDGPESMTAESLQLLNFAGPPEYFGAAHIQGIVNGQSSWVQSAVPEPSTALLASLSLVGLVGRRKRS